jgi:hypothetical protein
MVGNLISWREKTSAIRSLLVNSPPLQVKEVLGNLKVIGKHFMGQRNILPALKKLNLCSFLCISNSDDQLELAPNRYCGASFLLTPHNQLICKEGESVGAHLDLDANQIVYFDHWKHKIVKRERLDAHDLRLQNPNKGAICAESSDNIRKTTLHLQANFELYFQREVEEGNTRCCLEGIRCLITRRVRDLHFWREARWLELLELEMALAVDI